MSNVPPGIWLMDKAGWLPAFHTAKRALCFKWLVFVLTFFTYTSYHASRKPISVVKNVLNQNCTGRVPPAGVDPFTNPHWCDWKPFDGEDSNTQLGFVDSSYLFSYAFFMFFSGWLAERMHLRFFLSLGMLLSALMTWMFGIAFYWQYHHIAYFLIIQAVTGIFQASGWPGVVTVMGNWNGKRKRGLIFGIWNSHTSLGNILGSLMAGYFVDTNWGLSFIIPAVFIAAVGVVNFLFLTPYPQEIGCLPPAAPRKARAGPTSAESDGSSSGNEGGDSESTNQSTDDTDDVITVQRSTNQLPDDTEESVSEDNKEEGEEKAIGFFKAITLPGVIPFALCLFFAKLVSYTFLYWLPRYLHDAANYSPTESANLSTLFDVGGIVGGILAGFLNDWTGAPAIVCLLLLIVAIPVLFIYDAVATVSHGLNTFMLLVVGLLVNGPYALITTAVSADLGTSLAKKDSRALATVTAIIDGTGSVGAGLGPLLAGWASAGSQWGNVFIILMVADALAILCLGRVVRHEILEILQRRRERREQHQSLSADNVP